ncbi:hypothetical protein KCU83_g273, partial [Aureobasidium melanogenum]
MLFVEHMRKIKPSAWSEEKEKYFKVLPPTVQRLEEDRHSPRSSSFSLLSCRRRPHFCNFSRSNGGWHRCFVGELGIQVGEATSTCRRRSTKQRTTSGHETGMLIIVFEVVIIIGTAGSALGVFARGLRLPATDGAAGVALILVEPRVRRAGVSDILRTPIFKQSTVVENKQPWSR